MKNSNNDNNLRILIEIKVEEFNYWLILKNTDNNITLKILTMMLIKEYY